MFINKTIAPRMLIFVAALSWGVTGTHRAVAHEAQHGAKHGATQVAKPGGGHHAPARQHGIISLDIFRDGGLLHMLTAQNETRQATPQLWYRQSADGGLTWRRAVRIQTESSVYELTRGNDAQIAASGQRVLAVWTAKGSGYAGSGPLMSALSQDGGNTWRAGGNPADDKSDAGHAYAELTAFNGVFNAVWLDGRDGAQGLRYARSRDGVQWEKNTTVQAATCECCWQSLARHENQLLVMFRGKAPRDMVLAALPPGASAWNARGRVGKFDWDFKGCPHTGGSLVGVPTDKSLHALVWTGANGANGAQGLHHLWSRDGGANWNAGRRLGSTDAQRADIAVSDDGKTLAAVWDQLEGSRRFIFAAYSIDQGRSWSDGKRLSVDHADAMYPRVVAVRSGFLVLWTERDTSGASVLKTAAFHPK